MPSLEELTNTLKKHFDAKDYGSADALMPQMKVLLFQAKLLIPDLTRTGDKDYVADLVISRSILEIGALSAINLEEFDKFEQYVQQLKAFYFNSAKKDELHKSVNKNKLLSLYLLLLLSKGDVVQFHAELEFLTQNIKNIENDLYLNYPIKIENWVLEGYYDKAWELISNRNTEEKKKLNEFNIFNDTLLAAIREEISRSIENSYKSLPFSNAKYLLFLNSEKEVESFAEEQGWTIKNNELIFEDKSYDDKFALDGDEDVMDEDFDEQQGKLTHSEKLVKNTLNYAREIDSII